MKILIVFGLTALLGCCDAQNSDLEILRDEMVNSGTVVFVDFLERVRNATERLIRDDQFRKSRIVVQGYMKDLREFAKSVKNGASEDNSATSPQRFFTSASITLAQTMREIFDKFFLPYVDIYPQALKNETIVEIWKEVDSDYLPGAPPIFNKPMEFFSFLLAKAVVKSQTLNMLEAGLDTVRDIGKIDFNQLNEEVQMVLDQIRNKAFEISTLERQKEKNDFLVSLRTASGLIVFYWDKVLEQTESPSFDSMYLDSMKRWTELTELRNASEKYHVLLDPRTRQEYLNWTKRHFGEFLEALSQEYYSRGNEALGLERFNQSNWAVVKSAVVYSLPVYEKLSEVGFGFTEVNRFLHRTNHITLVLEDHDRPRFRETFLEGLIRFNFQILGKFADEVKNRDNPLLLPLRAFRQLILILWNFSLLRRYVNEAELQKIESNWNAVKGNFVDELVKSKAFTQEQIEETLNKRPIHQILERLEQYTDLFEDFDKSIDQTVSSFKYSLQDLNKDLLKLWDLLLE